MACVEGLEAGALAGRGGHLVAAQECWWVPPPLAGLRSLARDCRCPPVAGVVPANVELTAGLFADASILATVWLRATAPVITTTAVTAVAMAGRSQATAVRNRARPSCVWGLPQEPGPGSCPRWCRESTGAGVAGEVSHRRTPRTELPAAARTELARTDIARSPITINWTRSAQSVTSSDTRRNGRGAASRRKIWVSPSPAGST